MACQGESYVPEVSSGQGRRQGALDHAPVGAEDALCDCSEPSNRECAHRENVVGGRPQAPSNDEKSFSEKSLYVFTRKM